jgi:hypothetical protein
MSMRTEQAFSPVYHQIMQRRKGVNRTEVKAEYKLMSSIHLNDGREVVVDASEEDGQVQRCGWRNLQPIASGEEWSYCR